MAIVRWLIKLVVFISTNIVGHGILLWLRSQGYHPEEWVADVIGSSTAPEAIEAIRWVLAGILGLCGVGCYEFYWRRRMASGAISEQMPIADHSQSIAPENEQAATLIGALRITVGESGPYFETGGGVYDIKRTFNLKLENVDRSKPLSDCSIHIREVVPQTDYEGPWLLKDGITLAAGDHTFVPLVTYGEAREPDKYGSGDTFATMGTSTGRPTLDVGPEYTIALRATAQNTAFCDFECRVWIDKNGRLRIANATPTTADKPDAVPTDVIDRSDSDTAHTEQTRFEERGTEISTALLLIVDLSSWMRWQDAQRIGDGQAALTDDFKMNLAENVLRKKLGEGHLIARGRRRGALEYEKIPSDLWDLVYLDIQRDLRTLWRVTMKPRDGLEQEAVERIPDYVSLQVNEQRIKELWPAKDNQLDREIALLLERAQTKKSQ